MDQGGSSTKDEKWSDSDCQNLPILAMGSKEKKRVKESKGAEKKKKMK